MKKVLNGRHLKQGVRFGLVGVVNTLVDFAVLNLMVMAFKANQGVALLLCNAAAFVCANINSFYLNKFWTFGAREKTTFAQYGTFLWVSLVGLGINTLSLWLVVEYLTPHSLAGDLTWINLAKLIACLASLTWNYMACRQFVFHES